MPEWIAEAPKVEDVENPQTKDADGLTLRQKRFCIAYIRCGVGTQAAREAGYKGDSVALAVAANRLLKNGKVAAYISMASMGIEERLKLELENLAFGKPTDELTHQSKLRALELRSKVAGMLDKEQQRASVTYNTLVLDVHTMDEQTLMAHLDRIRSARAIPQAPIMDVEAQDTAQEGDE